jgi:aryl-alcohol dehydrogenase-like predicted oxidoreductase
MIDWFDKLELGTAQFGLDYGVNNGHKIIEYEAKKIVGTLNVQSPVLIDTAPCYGDSESVIERISDDNNKIISKLLSIKNSSTTEIISRIKATCSMFDAKLYGLMVHNADDVLDSDFLDVNDYLDGLRLKGIKIGVSVYSPEQVYKCNDIMKLDMVQIPLNIIDQRFDNEEFIGFVTKNNIEVHVRSVFLQGLILMENINIPKTLNKIIPYLDSLRSEASKVGVNIYELCLLYVFNKSWVKHVVIGLDSDVQAFELVSNIQNIMYKKINFDVSKFSCSDLNLINPVNWHHDN